MLYPVDVSGVGEREGRVLSTLVNERHFGLAHGIGRSGDLLEIQPKALGSALIYRLTNRITLQAMHCIGIHPSAMRSCIVVPVATGMALMLSLRSLHMKANDKRKTKVLWIRVDQKSAPKSVELSGMKLVVVSQKLYGDELLTDLEGLEETILKEDPAEILCVLSTSSCFAPRSPDNLPGIGKLCKKYDIFHLVNNAYGLQSSKARNLINETVLSGGRLDLIAQSTDKNFMVPVGGSIVSGPNQDLVELVGKIYPGRASISPVLDLFITLLSLGRTGLTQLYENRKVTWSYFQDRLKEELPSLGLRLLNTPRNDISMAIGFTRDVNDLGSRLYYRRVSGARLVKKSEGAGPFDLEGWGSHHPSYPHLAYLNVASAVGQKPLDIDLFFDRLKGCMR